ncbi:MAG: leucine-rich repeat domain-containing protein [Bacteroidales bacterium]|jgi:hypothetical protein|nr:leucine-rich repeat domain-containing protein [Bacteroidales bacterium]
MEQIEYGEFCGGFVWYVLNKNVLWISGKGNIPSDYEFTYRYDISTLIIENGIESFYDKLFSSLYNLVHIYIPASFKGIKKKYKINDSGFSNELFGGIKLLAIIVDNNNPNYCSEDGVLFNKAKTELIRYPAKKANAEYSVPSTVTKIWNEAFAHCENLYSLAIINPCWYGSEIFCDCINLQYLYIPSIAAIQSIDNLKFANGCKNLRCVSVNSLSINNNLFAKYPHLYKHYFYSEDGVLFEKGGDFCFGANDRGKYEINLWCYIPFTNFDENEKMSLLLYPQGKSDSVYIIPHNVVCINYGAFPHNTQLTHIIISKNMWFIGKGVFSNCDTLTSIYVDSNNYYYCSENGVLFNKYKTRLLYYPAKKLGEEYIIPESVVLIDREAFAHCEALTSIIIANVSIISSLVGILSLQKIVFKGKVPPIIYDYSPYSQCIESYDETAGMRFSMPNEKIKSPILYGPLGCKEIYENSDWGRFENIIEHSETPIKERENFDIEIELGRGDYETLFIYLRD